MRATILGPHPFFTEVIMNRSPFSPTFSNFSELKEYQIKTAIHEAGHAAGIYLGNRYKQLPPVFFQIWTSGLANHQRYSASKSYFAKVEGGRLIHTLPTTVEEAICDFTVEQQQAYQLAFEADIINLLIGPLAEANYVALNDDEIFNTQAVNLSALHHYGGTADLQLVAEYLYCLTDLESVREQKLNELFAAAFRFVNEGKHWRAIISLANAILANKNDVMDYDEISLVLDK